MSKKNKALLGLLLPAATLLQPAQAHELQQGENITLLGGTLAERMQHHGWLETYIQAAFPEKEISIRNNGFCGDKVDNRPRNRGFIDPHTYLEITNTDTIFAFWGTNESWDNSPEKFKEALFKWLDETNGKKYNGKSAPRVVLFSPIPHEDLNDPNFPDGKERNKSLQAYTAAMAEVAKKRELEFVNLYDGLKPYLGKKDKLTINGIFLSESGNHALARVIFKSLFGKDAPKDGENIEKIRQAVLDKNWHWYNRYRATDGNDVWGGRSGLRFVADQTNKDVLWHELDMIDVMTANRDKGIWSVAKGDRYKVDDSNVPPPIKVDSNVGGKSKSSSAQKEGSVTYMKPSETLAQFTLAPGMEANVFASEEMFPEIANPVQMSVDTRGRLWVAAWPTYPKWEPLKEMNDSLVILPDENRDGVADKAITFAKVHNPTGFEFWNGGVLVVSAPDILFLKDTDGDDVADVRIHILHGIDSADTHHTANNLIYGPDGHIYYQRGVFHVSNVETPWQAPQQHGNSAMYRFNPRTGAYAFHANNSPNPHGISFDYWGYHYATDGTGGRAYQVRPDGKGGFKMQPLLNKTVRPVPSSNVLSSAHFPEENQGNFLICNSIGFLGVKQYTLAEKEEGKGDKWGTETHNLLESPKDRNFRPTDIEVGDDGALYVSDWQNVIVGHMQHNVRDPNRNHTHGRVYRITAKDRPLMKHVKIDGEPIPALLDKLTDKTDVIRRRARIELSERDSGEVMAALGKWMKQWDFQNPAHAHNLLEGLWLQQQHNRVDDKLLGKVLESPVHHARIAAATVKTLEEATK